MGKKKISVCCVAYLLDFKFSLFGEDGLVDVVVLLADAAERGADLLVLLVAELPRRDHVVRLEQRVARHEAVLSAPVIIPTRIQTSWSRSNSNSNDRCCGL